MIEGTFTSNFDGLQLPRGKYHVESFRFSWHCVCDQNGFNVLSNERGAKFTSLERATEICEASSD